MKTTLALCALALCAAGTDLLATVASLDLAPCRIHPPLRWKLLLDLILCGLAGGLAVSGWSLVRRGSAAPRPA